MPRVLFFVFCVVSIALFGVFAILFSLGVDWAMGGIFDWMKANLSPDWQIGISVAVLLFGAWGIGMLMGYDHARKHAARGQLIDWEGRRVTGVDAP